MTGRQSLAGRRVVVTRPAEQAGELARKIEARGGVAVRFPVLAIFDAGDPRPLRAAAERIGDFDYAVFVSPNAAEKADVAPSKTPDISASSLRSGRKTK